MSGLRLLRYLISTAFSFGIGGRSLTLPCAWRLASCVGRIGVFVCKVEHELQYMQLSCSCITNKKTNLSF
jgi:hypothetical protein